MVEQYTYGNVHFAGITQTFDGSSRLYSTGQSQKIGNAYGLAQSGHVPRNNEKVKTMVIEPIVH